MKQCYKVLFLFLLFAGFLSAQNYDVPEILYYKFDSGTTTTPNYASPGGGTNPATLLNMTMGPSGQFDNALLGNGGTGTSTHVNSGWNMDLGTSSWTISVWMNNFPTASSTTYLFGNDITTSFRCFTNGAAGNTNITLRGTGITNVNVLGVLPGPTVVHFVYDSALTEIRTYVNGAFQSAVTQAPLNLNAVIPFKVGSYGTASSIPVGTMLDEFRFYRRALGVTEIADTWNQTLPYAVPVELTSFTAVVNDNSVTLNWSTATESNNKGFDIERKISNGTFEKISFVPGFGTTTENKSYIYKDENVQPGNYVYRLKQTDFDGTFEYSPEVEAEVKAPAAFGLEQNYPNPFNPSTTISWQLAVQSRVTIKLFNSLGQEISTLVDEVQEADKHSLQFNAGSDLPSGIYFYRIDASGIDGSVYSKVMKMSLIK
ncbi:MAG: T9SS type A sorting domain-containing protein [Ignavibacteriales bacterium]|nr:MAG: T9SS type A sorting domain-containing protein [Ignavibacteriales bacterium]